MHCKVPLAPLHRRKRDPRLRSALAGSTACNLALRSLPTYSQDKLVDGVAQSEQPQMWLKGQSRIWAYGLQIVRCQRGETFAVIRIDVGPLQVCDIHRESVTPAAEPGMAFKEGRQLCT